MTETSDDAAINIGGQRLDGMSKASAKSDTVATDISVICNRTCTHSGGETCLRGQRQVMIGSWRLFVHVTVHFGRNLIGLIN